MKSARHQVRLADVCEIEASLVDPRESAYRDLLHVGGANIESDSGRLLDLRTARDEGLISGKFLFDDDVVLYSKIRPYLKKVARPGFRGLCSADIYPLSPKTSSIDRDYLYYLLLTEEFTAFAEAGSARAGMPKVNREHLFQFTFSLPAVPEQRRIVGLLDETLAGVAAATANAERNVSNARAIFESYLHSVFTGRARHWRATPLADLCERERVITYGVIKLGAEQPTGVPCLRTSNVRWLRFELDGMKRIAPPLSEAFSRTILKGGEVLVNVRGTLGGVAVATPKMRGWNVSREVAVVPIDAKRIDPAYVSYFIGSGTSQEWLSDVKKGAAYVGINIEDLRRLPVRVPARDEQLEVVGELTALQQETERLASLYAKKQEVLGSMRQSLLHHAFTGQL